VSLSTQAGTATDATDLDVTPGDVLATGPPDEEDCEQGGGDDRRRGDAEAGGSIDETRLWMGRLNLDTIY
jgi:hypothetical protein